ncbi:Natterin-3 [Zootermopsis nevadensis]|uniref:Natterin-3 n=1 Tax=Zootermopsis nevadensis TaxID=136037 RepID=A0A067R8L4_ZOONE|nr:Natterin-3 [Zootermopsis nevadensis]
MSGACWVGAAYGSVPEGAVHAGYDKDGGRLFVGRTFYESDIMPAKIVPNQGTAYVSYDGQEHPVMHYEVLCNVESLWKTARDGRVPPNALHVGCTKIGERLYVGRVSHDGTLTPGKVHPSHRVCYIPYDGLEIPFKEYEVLVTK